MPSILLSTAPQQTTSSPTVLLVSRDSVLIAELQHLFAAIKTPLRIFASGDALIDTLRSLQKPAIALVDVRLGGTATGEILAAMEGSGMRRQCAIALVAETISDEWVEWLRRGVVDSIVPRGADTSSWRAHLSSMQRGHQLYCELEQLREASVERMRHDPVTGAHSRESMLTLLFRETDRVQRLHGSLCLVSFRIDDFAGRTREAGPQGSDPLVRETADRTRRMLRSYDLLGRTGPDEFLLALPGCSILDAANMAERMRNEVFCEPFAVRAMPKIARSETVFVRLTACFGVTASRGRSPLVVLREAERTLAFSQSFGPGTIRLATELLDLNGTADGAESLFEDLGELV